MDHGFLGICTEGLGLIICENLINPRLSMDHAFVGDLHGEFRLIICENLINPWLSMDHGFLGICTAGMKVERIRKISTFRSRLVKANTN